MYAALREMSDADYNSEVAHQHQVQQNDYNKKYNIAIFSAPKMRKHVKFLSTVESFTNDSTEISSASKRLQNASK